MESRPTQNGFIVRLSRGEKVLETLTHFCAQEGITGGFLWGLGALKNTELGYYSFDRREYFFKNIPEDREVASMTGNIALVEGKPFLHVHAILSSCDEELSCVGGHIKEAEVAVTLEVHISIFDSVLERQYDEETGLKLIRP